MSILSNIIEGVGADMAKRSYPAGPRKVAPLHPGEIIGSSLDDMRLSVRAAAKAIGVSHGALANVVAGKAAITPEMALRIGAFLGNGYELWLNLQQDYDVWHAKAAIGGELAKIKPAPAERT